MVDAKLTQPDSTKQTAPKSSEPPARSASAVPSSVSSASSASDNGSQGVSKANFDFHAPKTWLIGGVAAVMLIVILSVVYFAGWKTKDQPGQGITAKQSVLPENQAVDSPPANYEKPTALPVVTEEDDKKVLSDYFANETEYWKSEFISKVPSEARPALNNYQNAKGDDKVVLARTFYEIVSNPGLDDRNPDWINFLIKFREKLEEEVGKKLY